MPITQELAAAQDPNQIHINELTGEKTPLGEWLEGEFVRLHGAIARAEEVESEIEAIEGETEEPAPAADPTVVEPETEEPAAPVVAPVTEETAPVVVDPNAAPVVAPEDDAAATAETASAQAPAETVVRETGDVKQA